MKVKVKKIKDAWDRQWEKELNRRKYINLINKFYFKKLTTKLNEKCNN